MSFDNIKLKIKMQEKRETTVRGQKSVVSGQKDRI